MPKFPSGFAGGSGGGAPARQDGEDARDGHWEEPELVDAPPNPTAKPFGRPP